LISITAMSEGHSGSDDVTSKKKKYRKEKRKLWRL
jgi:hypothetical protein